MAKTNLNNIKKVEKINMQTIKEINQTLVAKDLSRKEIKVRHSEELFHKGVKWFESGLSLADAPLEMGNHDSFISGYNHGQRVKFVNDSLYDMGIDYFERGISLLEVPDNYKNNKFFLDGYNSKNMNNGRK